MLYVYGGLNSIKVLVKCIVVMKDIFFKNDIYFIYFMYDMGMLEEFKDILGFKNKEISNKVGVFIDYIDCILEWVICKVGGVLWWEMKLDVCMFFICIILDGMYFLM